MFPHREPQLYAEWWSTDRLVPMLLMLLLLGVVVWAVARFTRQPKVQAVHPGPGRPSPSATVDPALEQARLRYGRGELDRDTFLQIVGDLSPGGVEAGATDVPPPSATP